MQFSHVDWQMSVKNVDFMTNLTISQIPIHDFLQRETAREKREDERWLPYVLLRAHLFFLTNNTF